MSVVCVKVYDDRIEIASDSIIVKGYSMRSDSGFSKLSKINDMVIGAVGSAQEASLMWHYMETCRPKDASEKAVLDFIVGFAKWKIDYSNDKEIHNNYILAFGGKCFSIEGVFVFEVTNYNAIGAGMDFANAALYLGHTPKEAVKVASELSCYVSEPIIVETIYK